MKHNKPIEKVIVTYISEDESFKHDMYDDIEFIGINQVSKTLDENSYIKNIINKFIDI